MYHFITEGVKDYFVDGAFITLANGVIVIASFFNQHAELVYFRIPGALVLMFLGLVMTRPNSSFHWSKIKVQPLQHIKRLLDHPVFRKILRIYISLATIPFFILAMLMALSVLIPEEGQHVRAQLNNHSIILALGYLSTFTLLSIMLKAALLAMGGFINSVGEFKLRMMLW